MGEQKKWAGKMGILKKRHSAFYGVYKNKRVLVTGHTGFKGSWLCLWLKSLGASVLGFSKYMPSDPCHFQVARIDQDVQHCKGDICRYKDLKTVFDQFKPEMVFHLAAQPIVTTAYHDPKLTFETNLGGTVNVLECIRHSQSVQAAVIITSDKCYENVGWDWGYRETDRLGGADPYSASKACAEIAFSAYFRSFLNKSGSPVLVTARAGNVFGGGDWAKDRIVPDCIKAWRNGQLVQIRKPDATRPWLFVLEPISGYLWLGACLLTQPSSVNGESFNFGPDGQVISTVKELVESLAHHWKGARYSCTASGKVKEATFLKLSYDKVFTHTRWRPVLSFSKAIEMTADWYKAFNDGNKNMKDLSLEQIALYISLAKDKKVDWTGA